MLTPREQQALSLIARGFTDREIAGLLAVSLSTARKHRENLQRKLGLRKSAQLTIHYLEHLMPEEKKIVCRAAQPPQRSGSPVLALLAQGLSDKQAARALGISDLTVRKHRGNLQQKLQVANVCALLFEAVLNGWLNMKP